MYTYTYVYIYTYIVDGTSLARLLRRPEPEDPYGRFSKFNLNITTTNNDTKHIATTAAATATARVFALGPGRSELAGVTPEV